ncbi:septum formation protein Maf [Gordoniibacillus kamchatkensis]|uniref:dTTP/UTP pyrophosphatase n=1 Tax=Gordoniibacillus kamchatkensis TaxID=1590651 RepID=A0ABR5AJK3_9BACL|nr:Maf family protein [Paenibacillus sp. VKM B-2647]KIL41018.1 septum formation protein Maf [Paenibacillus sp. VKM B-2647]
MSRITHDQIILASSSPRRKELLSGLKIPFITHPSAEDEDVTEGTPPQKIVEILALRKAKSVASHYENGLIIGSDTIVVLENDVLGKPKDHNDAFNMLSKLQGQLHTVFTGLAIVNAKSGQSKVSYNSTEVKIKSLTNDQIRRYIATGEPDDKAGSYAIQGIGATLVEKINGDYFTVVGLPVGLLSDMLSEFGVNVF